MGWAIMFLVLIALVIILSISLINWKIQIYKVIVQLNAILNRKTKKLVTVSLSDRRLEHLVEIINQIVSKDNIYLGEIQKKENELKENISCLSHDLRTPLTSIRGYLQLLSSAPDEKRAEYISALSGKALRLERLIDDFYQISLLEAGQYPFYYEKVELCSLLTEILLDNYSIFSVNGIEPQIEIPNMDIYISIRLPMCVSMENWNNTVLPIRQISPVRRQSNRPLPITTGITASERRQYIRFWNNSVMTGCFMCLRARSGKRIGMGVFPAITKPGRKPFRSTRTRTASAKIGMFTLWWIVATPDLSISFLRRPGSIIQRNMGRKSRSAKA